MMDCIKYILEKLSVYSFNSCNKNFLNLIFVHVNFTKRILLECSNKNLHEKIENDFEEFKQVENIFLFQLLNLIVTDDWPNYFDNYGLSFSSYNRVKSVVLLKVLKKLYLSESTSSFKQTFSKFFTKEKSEKTNLPEIISSLQKLIDKEE
ncbi:hypothetical protein HZS_4209 [Henneguya salminicola]|nr:hypothetical protein HZS_4209 [Henneguya salminicola]